MPDSSKNLSSIAKGWRVGLKSTEFAIIEPVFKYNEFHKLLHKNIANNVNKNWILETLVLEDKVALFKSCKTLIMVGCGMYPYSMMDIYKKFPYIKQIGIDYDKNCVKISNVIIEKCNLSSMTIIHSKGEDYDYSTLSDEDLVFISCDVTNIDTIYSRVIETSKAQTFVCAPGKNTCFNNYFS